MEPFELQLQAERLMIEPQDNGTYRILKGEEKMGVIYPDLSDNGTEWKTMDELDADFVKQLGELISEHQAS